MRGVHALIYVVAATSTFVLLYAGVSGAQGWWLWVGLILLVVETVVFAGNGMKCPVTALAVSYGAEKGYAPVCVCRRQPCLRARASDRYPSKPLICPAHEKSLLDKVVEDSRTDAQLDSPIPTAATL